VKGKQPILKLAGLSRLDPLLTRRSKLVPFFCIEPFEEFNVNLKLAVVTKGFIIDSYV
jgi:hypothetical protein